MPKEAVNPPGLFPSLQHGFSQVVVARGARMVFLSGQTAWVEIEATAILEGTSSD